MVKGTAKTVMMKRTVKMRRCSAERGDCSNAKMDCASTIPYCVMDRMIARTSVMSPSAVSTISKMTGNTLRNSLLNGTKDPKKLKDVL